MADIGNNAVFSEVDGNNNSGTQPSHPEGQSPGSLNNGVRALQGALKRFWDRLNGTLTSTGAANAYVLTYPVAPAAYYDGERYLWEASFANTGAATVNVNALGNVALKKLVSGVPTDLVSGDVVVGARVEMMMDTSANAFIILRGVADINLNSALAFAGNNTHAGTETFNNTLTATKEVIFSGFITPAQITADQTDYAPANHATARTLRVSSDAYRTINSLAGGVDGREVILENIGSSTIALLEDNGSTGTAAMRFKTSAGFGAEIFAGCSALLRYDGTASRWYVITPAVASAGPSTMEAASSTASFVSPGNMHRHPGAPKFWGKATVSAGTPTLQVSYNITSITDAATGRLTVTIATDMSGAQYCITGLAERDSTGVGNTDRRVVAVRNGTQAAGAFDLDCMDVSSGSLSDPAAWHFAGLGDQ